jgi:hypothetical protein
MASISISQNQDSWITIIGKVGIFILLIVWTQNLLSQERPWIFLDGVNLLFHEAGHVLFIFGGEFLSFLGGTIAQLSIPCLIGIYFLIKKQFFELFFSLFWLGDNLINVSLYIKDARSQTLELVGGGIHDWNTILSQLNLLSSDQIIGSVVSIIGNLCLIISLLLIFLSIAISILKKLG